MNWLDKRVTLETEKLAYTFQLLVGDFGGSLGLFIGFSFMMIFDMLQTLMEKFKEIICRTDYPKM